MFKKILTFTTLFTLASSTAFAGGVPYVGAGLGMNTLTASYHGVASNAVGVPIDLFAGYGSTVNSNFYMGGELFLTPATFSVSSTTGNYVKTTYSYGASVLPGVMFSDHTLGYVRAGLVRSHFSTGNQMRNGGQLGAGIQTNISPNIDLRGEYVFTGYNTVRNAGSPRSDAFKLGILYKFE
jgi:opacity protein-like surface antigen